MSDFLSKKNLKKIIVIATILLISLTITGCVSTSSNGSVPPLSNNSGSFWDRYILYYISSFILWLATILHNAYGWSIVVFTIIVRVVLLPLNAISIKSMAKQQSLQPEMEALRKKYSDRDAETRRKLQEETSKLYKESGVNPYLGCLPMLIQMPIMIALWQAILRTPELQNGRFLWMDLGHPDPYMVMPILAAIFTFIASYIGQLSQAKSSNNAMTKGMTYVMPVFIGVMACSLQSALSLYWVISNLFQSIQTFFLQNPIKYYRELKLKQLQEKERKAKYRKIYKKFGRKIK